MRRVTAPLAPWGVAASAELELDPPTVRDINELFYEWPMCTMARDNSLAMAAPDTFTFEIPVLQVRSNEAMDVVIRARWMPWLRVLDDWINQFGICPVRFEMYGEHAVPVTPDLEMGYITVQASKSHKPVYKYYYSHGSVANELAKDMLWVLSDHPPTIDGCIRSPLRSLLGSYRSLCKLGKNRDIVATQRARVVHLIEATGDQRSAFNDNLTGLTATYAKAAGVGKERREAARETEMIQQQQRLLASINRAGSNASKGGRVTLWTDAHEDVLEEMDAGFTDRVIPIRQGHTYKSATMPELVGDYDAAAARFDMQVAALMGFSLELLAPTGAARSQNTDAAIRFVNDRARQKNAFFISVLKPLLLLAYKKQFKDVLDHATNWRNMRLNGDPTRVMELMPDVDVIVSMPMTSMVTDEQAYVMRDAGIITQDVMGRHVFRNHGLSDADRVNLQWPDNVPRERLVKPQQEPATKKAKTKKPAKKTE